MKWSFQVNQYDYEGDLFDECIIINFGEQMVRFEDKDHLESALKSILASLEDGELGETIYYLG